MATIKGKWVFNESIEDAQAVSQNVSFSSNTILYSTMYVSLSSMAGTPVLHYDEEIVFDLMGFDADFRGWKGDTYRTVDFGATEQTVSDTFLTWITANATPEAEPIPTDKVSVLYKGELIGKIEQNNEGVIGCTGETMEDDITIRVPAMGAGATVYSIDWNFSMVEVISWAKFYDFISPSYIAEGKTISAVFFSTSIPLDVENSNCDVSLTYYTVSNISLPTGAFSGHLVILKIANPTGDINISLSFSTGGSN